MAIGKRILLFLGVNVLVMVTINLVLNLLGVRPYLDAKGINYESLLIFCLVWGMGGAFISLMLSKTMAKWMMGVQIVSPQVSHGVQKELLDMVYRLAKPAGLTTMPEVGIYDSPEINAFATGPSKNNSLVAVSTGLLNRMDKNEVEGVIGHEIAHIANGDMVTMTLVQGIMNAFVMFLARIIAWTVSQNAKEESRFAIQFGVTMLLEIVLSILGAIVVAYFSRHREYRADAGGARLAGRDKMISALKALKGTLNRIDTEHQAFATLKISGKRAGLMALLSTHPSLDDRIARLERGL